MQKITFLFFIFVSSLTAQDASQEQLNSIYQEALLFVAIFGVMGIVSYIYSSKHAKEYVPKEPTQEELDVKAFKESRVKDLSNPLAKNPLTKAEFELLSQHYKS